MNHCYQIILCFCLFILYSIDNVLTVEIESGKTLKVCCSPNSNTGKPITISWNKNGDFNELGHLVEGKIMEIDIKSPYKLIKDQDSLCLIRDSASQNENFDVKCRIKDGPYGKILSMTKITVKSIVPLKFIQVPGPKYDTKVGESVQLICKTQGAPNLQTVLKYKGKEIKSGTNELNYVIPQVTSDMFGDVYTCEATIDAKLPITNKISSDVILNVQHSPKLEFEKDIISTDYGLTEVIKITVNANPTAQLQCVSENNQAAMVTSTASDRDRGKYIYTLTINNITKQTKGDYRCTATNSEGTKIKTISLSVKPLNLKITSPSTSSYSDYYSLKWEVQSKSPITKIIITYQSSKTNEKITKEFSSTDVSKLIQAPLASNTNNYLHSFLFPMQNLTDNSRYNIIVKVCNRNECDEMRPQNVNIPSFNNQNKIPIDALQKIMDDQNRKKSGIEIYFNVFLMTTVQIVLLLWNRVNTNNSQ